MEYWLLKSEPDTFSIHHLENSPNRVTTWEGVRNYQARNFLRDRIKQGDLAFFYHSSCPLPGIAGIVKVISNSYPDISALDPASPYYDPKSSSENPRWYTVDVQLVEIFPQIISLQRLRETAALSKMILLQKGNRLSVMPISQQEWHLVTQLIKNE